MWTEGLGRLGGSVHSEGQRCAATGEVDIRRCPCSSETGNTSVPQLPQHSCTMAFVLLALLGIRIQDDLFGLPKYYAPKLEEAWEVPVVK